MARVFVSHDGDDRKLAHEVHRWLSQDDYQVFLDQDLHDGLAVGDDWKQRLYERLRWADASCVGSPPPIDRCRRPVGHASEPPQPPGTVHFGGWHHSVTLVSAAHAFVPCSGWTQPAAPA
jgi:hypothetical protein